MDKYVFKMIAVDKRALDKLYYLLEFMRFASGKAKNERREKRKINKSHLRHKRRSIARFVISILVHLNVKNLIEFEK